MRRMILPLMLFAFAACQPATMELTDAEKAAIAEEVTAIHDQMWDAWPDLAAGMSYFDNSPDVAYAADGDIHLGFDNITAVMEPFTTAFDRFEITVERRQTTVLSHDVVCVTERGVQAAYDSTGAILASGPVALTAVWVRRDGDWKVVQAHESFPPPETESM